MVCSDVSTAEPIAVMRSGRRLSMALLRSWLSLVGACTRKAPPEKATMPIFTARGRSLTNSLAATCAAVMRVGLTSSARMLPDTSIAMMSVPRWLAKVMVAAGLASATISTAIARKKSVGGTARPTRPSHVLGRDACIRAG